MVFFHWHPVVKYSLRGNSFRHPSTSVSTLVAMDFSLAWYNSTQKLPSLVATFSTQFQDWSQEAHHELHPSGCPVTQRPSCRLVKAAIGFPISRHKESSSSKCVRTWAAPVAPSGAGKIRQLAFQIPTVSKRAAAARLGGAGAIDAGKHFSVAERNPCWTQYGLRSSLPFHDEVNDRVHTPQVCHKCVHRCHHHRHQILPHQQVL